MTEPEKWRDPWFRSLSPDEKLVFLFLVDQCDWGGFYEIDESYMAFCIGIDEGAISGALKGLARGCIVADGWVWVKNFLKHQKNDKLNPENNAHKNVINCINEQLTRFVFVPEFKEFLGAYKGLLSPIGKGKGRGKGNSSGESEKSKPQDVAEVIAYFQTLQAPSIEAEKFFDHYTANGWKQNGGKSIKDWKAAARNWKRNMDKFSGRNGTAKHESDYLPHLK